jgi:hypothetical protein
MMITITAMKWAPPFAAGSVRDHRARWILNEVGWPYEVRLIDATDLASNSYRSKQPFGQVPYLEGRRTTDLVREWCDHYRRGDTRRHLNAA